jgi:hypothetical protein
VYWESLQMKYPQLIRNQLKSTGVLAAIAVTGTTVISIANYGMGPIMQAASSMWVHVGMQAGFTVLIILGNIFIFICALHDRTLPAALCIARGCRCRHAAPRQQRRVPLLLWREGALVLLQDVRVPDLQYCCRLHRLLLLPVLCEQHHRTKPHASTHPAPGPTHRAPPTWPSAAADGPEFDDRHSWYVYGAAMIFNVLIGDLLVINGIIDLGQPGIMVARYVKAPRAYRARVEPTRSCPCARSC